MIDVIWLGRCNGREGEERPGEAQFSIQQRNGCQWDGLFFRRGHPQLQRFSQLDSFHQGFMISFSRETHLFLCLFLERTRWDRFYRFQLQSERVRCRKPEQEVPEVGQLRPQRKLFENWVEYLDPSSGRPFYYNELSRLKSWKPPRRRGSSSPTMPSEEVNNSSPFVQRDTQIDDPIKCLFSGTKTGMIRWKTVFVHVCWKRLATGRCLPFRPDGMNPSIRARKKSSTLTLSPEPG